MMRMLFGMFGIVVFIAAILCALAQPVYADGGGMRFNPSAILDTSNILSQ